MVRALIAGEKKFVSMLSPLVKSCGIDVTTAQGARESLGIQQREKLDCVFIQERYEDESGEHLMNELKKSSPKLIVIVSLNRRDAASALRWMEAGAYECLYEPFNPKEARAVIVGVGRTLSGTFLPTVPFYRRMAFPSQFSFKNVTAAVVGLVGILLLIWGGQILFQKVHRSQPETVRELPLSFRLPYPNPTGISWDGKNLWISDWSTQTIYKHKIDPNLTMEKFFPMSDIPTVSLAWGDSALWTVGQDGNVRKHLLDGRLSVISVIRLPGATPSALAWDGKNLWSSDAQSRKIYRHIPDENLTVIATYDFPGKNPVGMVWIGRDLWIADEGTGTIYRLNFDKEVFTLAESLRPGVHLPGTNKLSGICSDGKNLWTISEGNGLIFRHSLSTLRGG